jgi:2-iminobutanoate/2-iminopropanoate deaminase
MMRLRTPEASMKSLRFAEVVTMGKKPVTPPVAPYIPGVIAGGNLLFVSGQIPVDQMTGELGGGTFRDRFRRAILNFLSVVESAGGGPDNKVTVYLTDISNYPEFNGVYSGVLGGARLGRSVVEVSNLPKGADIWIEAIPIL